MRVAHSGAIRSSGRIPSHRGKAAGGRRTPVTGGPSRAPRARRRPGGPGRPPGTPHPAAVRRRPCGPRTPPAGPGRGVGVLAVDGEVAQRVVPVGGHVRPGDGRQAQRQLRLLQAAQPHPDLAEDVGVGGHVGVELRLPLPRHDQEELQGAGVALPHQAPPGAGPRPGPSPGRAPAASPSASARRCATAAPSAPSRERATNCTPAGLEGVQDGRPPATGSPRPPPATTRSSGTPCTSQTARSPPVHGHHPPADGPAGARPSLYVAGRFARPARGQRRVRRPPGRGQSTTQPSGLPASATGARCA